jgi:ABC-type lipoprotein release transport system permease subunit
VVRGFGLALPGFFPVIRVEPLTIALALCAAVLSGLAAAAVPTARAIRTPIVSGLRTIG